MKYIHDYQDGSFCMSDTFMEKVRQENYYAVSDSDYEDLVKGTKKIENGKIVVNENYIEQEVNE